MNKEKIVNELRAKRNELKNQQCEIQKQIDDLLVEEYKVEFLNKFVKITNLSITYAYITNVENVYNGIKLTFKGVTEYAIKAENESVLFSLNDSIILHFDSLHSKIEVIDKYKFDEKLDKCINEIINSFKIK